MIFSRNLFFVTFSLNHIISQASLKRNVCFIIKKNIYMAPFDKTTKRRNAIRKKKRQTQPQSLSLPKIAWIRNPQINEFIKSKLKSLFLSSSVLVIRRESFTILLWLLIKWQRNQNLFHLFCWPAPFSRLHLICLWFLFVNVEALFGFFFAIKKGLWANPKC